MKIVPRQHLFFWIGYMLFGFLQLYFSYATDTVFNMDVNRTDYTLSFVYAALVDVWPKIICFYLLYYFVTRPYFFEKKSKVYPLLTTILIVIGFTLIMRAVNFYIIFPEIYHYDMKGRFFFNITAVTMTFFDLLLPCCVLMIYELYRFTRYSREKTNQLEKEKLKSELRFLKAQINPHFLFNVLSTVHALSRQKAPEAANVVIKLSELMRFMLYEVKNKFVTLENEIKFLEGYIELEKIRFRDKLEVKFETDIDDETVTIAPMILLPFVENAFKHGAAESRFCSFVHIYIKLKKQFLSFEVENSVEPAEADIDTTGIGLANVKRQLELIYPGHKLTLEGKDGKFFAELNLNLDSHDQSVLHDY